MENHSLDNDGMTIIKWITITNQGITVLSFTEEAERGCWQGRPNEKSLVILTRGIFFFTFQNQRKLLVN